MTCGLLLTVVLNVERQRLLRELETQATNNEPARNSVPYDFCRKWKIDILPIWDGVK